MIESSYVSFKKCTTTKLKMNLSLDYDEYDSPEWHHEFPHDSDSILPDISETSHLMTAKFTSPLYAYVTVLM